MGDPFDLDRFVTAQADSYATALVEIRGGRKRSHWMWYVFPQLAGLGHSAMAQHYGVSGTEEAQAYLAHPLLGPRYRTIVEALQALPETTAETVFGAADAMKLRSSLTLFWEASGVAGSLRARRRLAGAQQHVRRGIMLCFASKF